MKNNCLTFNGNLGQRKGLALPLRPTAVPPDRSAPSSRPAGKFCCGLPSGARWWSPTGGRYQLGDEERSPSLHLSLSALPHGVAVRLAGCGAAVPTWPGGVQPPNSENGRRDPFVHKTFQLLMQRANNNQPLPPDPVTASWAPSGSDSLSGNFVQFY